MSASIRTITTFATIANSTVVIPCWRCLSISERPHRDRGLEIMCKVTVGTETKARKGCAENAGVGIARRQLNHVTAEVDNLYVADGQARKTRRPPGGRISVDDETLGLGDQLRGQHDGSCCAECCIGG